MRLNFRGWLAENCGLKWPGDCEARRIARKASGGCSIESGGPHDKVRRKSDGFLVATVPRGKMDPNTCRRIIRAVDSNC